MSTFPSMAKIVPEGQIGIAAVSHYEISKLDALRDSMHGMYTEPKKIAILKVGGQVMMSDSTNEERSNRTAVWKAQGDMLIAGLGLGMILHPILANPKVTSVTVIEKYQDVIDLILPTIESPKLTVICADIMDWKPAKGTRFDCIYFDIWADICTDNLKQINTLHQRFKGFKKPEGWMTSWCVDELRWRKRNGR